MSLIWTEKHREPEDDSNGTWTGLAAEIFGVIMILITFYLLALVISVLQ